MISTAWDLSSIWTRRNAFWHPINNSQHTHDFALKGPGTSSLFYVTGYIKEHLPFNQRNGEFSFQRSNPFRFVPIRKARFKYNKGTMNHNLLSLWSWGNMQPLSETFIANLNHPSPQTSKSQFTNRSSCIITSYACASCSDAFRLVSGPDFTDLLLIIPTVVAADVLEEYFQKTLILWSWLDRRQSMQRVSWITCAM